MLLTYYTLARLASEWNTVLGGGSIVEAWSQQRDELSLAIAGRGDEASTLVVVGRPDRRLLFRNRSHGRARRHTASLFQAAEGRAIWRVRAARRDRVVYVELEDGLAFHIALFGPRPNVWLIDREAETVVESFAASADWEGKPAPGTRPAPVVDTLEAFDARWPGSGAVDRAVARAMPLFDSTLAAETVFRAGIVETDAASLDEDARRRLFHEALRLEAALDDPRPTVYWRGDRAEGFSLTQLLHLEAGGMRPEHFERVDEAVRVFCHRTLAHERFDARHGPLLARLRQAHERAARSAERMTEELERPSRADEHERFGHLLMALATNKGAGLGEAELPDILGEGEPVRIPLDPALTAIENARRYYDLARRSREARRHAEARWEDVRHREARLADLLARLQETGTLDDLDRFVSDHEAELAAILGSSDDEGSTEPFRRFPLPGGLEAWVGKHARGNAELTTRHAGPHDLWLHARGFPGSHVVIRRPARGTDVPQSAIEAAAGLAAWFSKGRGSALVPVQVTERKHVRPIKGGPPGAMRVERESVLLVPPTAPRR